MSYGLYRAATVLITNSLISATRSVFISESLCLFCHLWGIHMASSARAVGTITTSNTSLNEPNPNIFLFPPLRLRVNQLTPDQRRPLPCKVSTSQFSVSSSRCAINAGGTKCSQLIFFLFVPLAHQFKRASKYRTGTGAIGFANQAFTLHLIEHRGSAAITDSQAALQD